MCELSRGRFAWRKGLGRRRLDLFFLPKSFPQSFGQTYPPLDKVPIYGGTIFFRSAKGRAMICDLAAQKQPNRGYPLLSSPIGGWLRLEIR